VRSEGADELTTVSGKNVKLCSLWKMKA